MSFITDIAKKIDNSLSKIEAVQELNESPRLLASTQWEEGEQHAPDKDFYLMDENCLLLSPTLAAVFGVPKALILQQVHYFVLINKQRETAKSYYMKGQYWMYATLSNWQKQFPFLSVATIKRAIHDLVMLDRVLARRQTRKENIPQTFYRVDYERLSLFINHYEPKKYQKELLRKTQYNPELNNIQKISFWVKNGKDSL